MDEQKLTSPASKTETALEPIEIYFFGWEPEPPMIRIILGELNVPYQETLVIDKENRKKDFVTNIIPNRKTPAIRDPNTGLIIWGSSSVVIYLIDMYDKDHHISYGDPFKKYQTLSWLHFQATDQSPHFYQAYLCSITHGDHLKQFRTHSFVEMLRVIQVLDKQLSKSQYLVGEKCTYADLSFVSWNKKINRILNRHLQEDLDVDLHAAYPHFKQWYEKLLERKSVSKALDKQLQENEVDSDDERDFFGIISTTDDELSDT